MVDLALRSAVIGATSRVENISDRITVSTGKLSSGQRIPSPKDDIANFAISSRLATSIIAQNAINANLSTGVSMGQAADGVYSQTVELMQRMKILALQASSENLGDTERELLDREYQKLLLEVDRIAKDAKFNGISLAETGLFAATSIEGGLTYAGGDLPAGSFIAPGVAVDVGGAINLMRTTVNPDGTGGNVGNNSRGAYLNDTTYDLSEGLTASIQLRMGATLGGGTQPGGGFNFVLFDGDGVDWSGASGADGLGVASAGRMSYIADEATSTPVANGYLSVGLDSRGVYGLPSTVRDTVTIIGSEPGDLVNSLPVSAFPAGLDGPGGGTTSAQQRSLDLNVTLTSDGVLNVVLTDVGAGVSVDVATDLDISGLTAPETVKFGLIGHNGGGRQQILIDSFSVSAGVVGSTNLQNLMNEAGIAFKASVDSISPNQELLLPIFDATARGVGLNGTSIGAKSDAEIAITQLDAGLELAVEARAIIGAATSIFEGAIDTLSTKVEKLERARSGLSDLNIAAEVSRLTALQLQQISGLEVISRSQETLRTMSLVFNGAESVSRVFRG